MLLKSICRCLVHATLVVSVFLSLSASYAAPNEDNLNALWVAESEGLLKLATVDGRVLIQIPQASDIRALDVDAENGLLWAASRYSLRTYAFNGALMRSVPLPGGVDSEGEYEHHDHVHDGGDYDRILAFNPSTDGVFLASAHKVLSYDAYGTLGNTITLNQEIEALSYDAKDNILWIGTEHAILAYDANTLALLHQYSLSYYEELEALAFDPALNQLWVATENQLYLYTFDGQRTGLGSYNDVVGLVPDGTGRVWLAGERNLYYIDASGIRLLQVQPFQGSYYHDLKYLVADPADQSVWVSSKRKLAHITIQGVIEHQLDINNRIYAIALYSDIIAPTLDITAPENGSWLNTSLPSLNLTMTDVGIGMDLSTLSVTDNANPVDFSCTAANDEYVCSPGTALTEGLHTLSFEVSDYVGNTSGAAVIDLGVDTIAPTVTVTSPAEGFVTNQANQELVGEISETVNLTINGYPVSTDANLGFHYPVVLTEGNNSYTITATDQAGNQTSVTHSLTLDTIPPSSPLAPQISITDIGKGKVQITGAPGTVESGAMVKIRNLRSGEVITIQANSDGSFSAVMLGIPGDAIAFIAVDAAGNESSAINKQLPETTDMSIGYINGTVFDARSKTPLSDVEVHVRGYQETTSTNSQGEFILPITGNKTWTVFLEKVGFVEARRDIYVRRGGDATVGKVGMQSWDPKEVTINAAAGGSFTDSTGNVEVIFPPGALPHDMPIRASYLQDKESFPLRLPENMVYMGGVQMGPEHVHFNSPVRVKVKNTLNFPAGTKVPFFFASHDPEDTNEGFYDPGEGTVSQDGQVVEFQVEHFSCMALGAGPPGSGGDGSGEGDDSSNNDDCQAGKGGTSEISYCNGSLKVTHEVPEFYALGRNDSPSFTYDSRTASSYPIISTNIDARGFYANSSNPDGLRLKLKIAGKETEAYANSSNEVIPFRFVWDRQNARNKKVGTGVYPYELNAAEYYLTYAGQPLTEPYTNSINYSGVVMVNDQSQSPFGAGWSMTELEKLNIQADGTLLLTKGSGGSIVFNPMMGLDVSKYSVLASGLGETRSITKDPLGDGYYVSSYDTGEIHHVSNAGAKQTIVSGISAIKGIAIDQNETLYIASEGSASVYQLVKGATVPVLYATLPQIDHMDDIAVDKDGNVYVLDGGFGVIHKITAKDTVSYFYNGLENGIGNGLLNNSMSMSFDSRGNLYVSNNYNLFGEVSCGVSYISRFDKLGNHTYFYVGLNAPRGVTIDENDNVYVMDYDCEGNSYDLKVVNQQGRLFKVSEGIPGALDVFGLGYDLDYRRGVIAGVLNSGELITFTTDSGLINQQSFIANGNFSKITRDASDNYIRTEVDGTHVIYDSKGNHIGTYLKRGLFWKYQYDSQNRLISRENAVGQVWLFEYGANGISSMTDPSGKVTNFTIDGAGNLIGVIEPENVRMSYQYSSEHLMTGKTDNRGFTTSYTYTDKNTISQAVLPTGETRKFDPARVRGAITGSDAENSSTAQKIIFNTNDTLDKFVDGRNITTTYKTNKYGSIIEMTDGSGAVTTYIRNSDNQIVKSILPNNSVVKSLYTSIGLLARRELWKSDTDTSDIQWTSYEYDENNRLTTIDSNYRPYTTYQYDANDNPIVINVSDSIITELSYNLYGQPLSVKKAETVQNNVYDTYGRMISTSDALGKTTVYTYDASGNRMSDTDSLGRKTQYQYDQQNRIISITSPSLITTSFSYVAACSSCGREKHLLSSITDGNGNQSTFEYNSIGKIIKDTDPAGKSTLIDYDLNQNVTKTTDSNGQVINYYYDNNDRLIRKELPGEVVDYSYDVLGNLLTVSDADSSISNSYNEFGKLVNTTTGGSRQLSSSTDFQYRNINALYTHNTSIDSPTGAVSVSYLQNVDLLNRVTEHSMSQHSSSNYEYDSAGRRSSLRSGTINSIRYSYDASSRLKSIAGQDSPISVSYSYYDDGSVASKEILINGDSGNDAITIDKTIVTSDTITISGETQPGFIVQVNGNNVAVDASGNINAPVSLPVLGLNPIEVIVTNSTGNVIKSQTFSVTRELPSSGVSFSRVQGFAPNGDIYANQLDTNDIVAVSKTTGFVGQPSWLVGAKAIGINSAGVAYYIKGTASSAVCPLLLPNCNPTAYITTPELWRYDGVTASRILTLPDDYYNIEITNDNTVYISTTNTIYRLDGASLVTHVSFPLAATPEAILMDSSAYGLVVSYKGDTGLSMYKVNADGTLLEFVQPVLGDFGVSDAGEVCPVNGGEWVYCTNQLGEYASDLWCYAENFKFNGSMGYFVEFDGSLFSCNTLTGDQAQAAIGTGTTSAMINVQVLGTGEAYQYDLDNRLISATSPTLTGSYSYDSAGNRTADSGASDYVYNNLNQIISGNGATYTYDNNGNRLSKTDTSGVTTYAWDSENRLVAVAVPNGTVVNYAYDPLGRRIERSITTTTGQVTTYKYVYDGYDILAIYEGDNSWVFHQGPGIDEHISVKYNGVVYKYHTDSLGSVVALSDNSGNIIQRYKYDSYGNIIHTKDPAFKQPYGFTGREWDSVAELHYYRARYYDSSIGKFISRDPLSFDGGDFNLYGYVLNNPLKYIDPFGLETLTVGIGVRVPGWMLRLIFPDFRGEGLGVGIAISGPDECGNGEYDLGGYLSLDFVGDGKSPSINLGGRASFDLGLHNGSVKDLAGVGGEVSAMAGPVGGTVNYDSNGITGAEVNLGYGINAGGNASMTSTISIRHEVIPLP